MFGGTRLRDIAAGSADCTAVEGYFPDEQALDGEALHASTPEERVHSGDWMKENAEWIAAQLLQEVHGL
jgi:hypothetical protein